MLNVNRKDEAVYDVLSYYRAECTPDIVDGVSALSALCRDDYSLCLCIQFDNPGICSSRPAFLAAVDAAANAIWSETYHALYYERTDGAEALPMSMNYGEANYAESRNN